MAGYSYNRSPRARKRYIIETSSDEDSDSEEALAVQSELISSRKSPQSREASPELLPPHDLPRSATHPGPGNSRDGGSSRMYSGLEELDDIQTGRSEQIALAAHVGSQIANIMPHVDFQTRRIQHDGYGISLCENLDNLPRIAIGANYANASSVFSAVVFDLINHGSPYAPVRQHIRLGNALYRCEGPGCLFACKAQSLRGRDLTITEYQPTHSLACRQQACRQQAGRLAVQPPLTKTQWTPYARTPSQMWWHTNSTMHTSNASGSTGVTKLLPTPALAVSYSSREDLFTATQRFSDKSKGPSLVRLRCSMEKTVMRITCPHRGAGCTFAVRARIAGDTGKVCVIRVNLTHGSCCLQRSAGTGAYLPGESAEQLSCDDSLQAQHDVPALTFKIDGHPADDAALVRANSDGPRNAQPTMRVQGNRDDRLLLPNNASKSSTSPASKGVVPASSARARSGKSQVIELSDDDGSVGDSRPASTTTTGKRRRYADVDASEAESTGSLQSRGHTFAAAYISAGDIFVTERRLRDKLARILGRDPIVRRSRCGADAVRHVRMSCQTLNTQCGFRLNALRGSESEHLRVTTACFRHSDGCPSIGGPGHRTESSGDVMPPSRHNASRPRRTANDNGAPVVGRSFDTLDAAKARVSKFITNASERHVKFQGHHEWARWRCRPDGNARTCMFGIFIRRISASNRRWVIHKVDLTHSAKCDSLRANSRRSADPGQRMSKSTTNRAHPPIRRTRRRAESSASSASAQSVPVSARAAAIRDSLEPSPRALESLGKHSVTRNARLTPTSSQHKRRRTSPSASSVSEESVAVSTRAAAIRDSLEPLLRASGSQHGADGCTSERAKLRHVSASLSASRSPAPVTRAQYRSNLPWHECRIVSSPVDDDDNDTVPVVTKSDWLDRRKSSNRVSAEQDDGLLGLDDESQAMAAAVLGEDFEVHCQPARPTSTWQKEQSVLSDIPPPSCMPSLTHSGSSIPSSIYSAMEAETISAADWYSHQRLPDFAYEVLEPHGYTSYRDLADKNIKPNELHALVHYLSTPAEPDEIEEDRLDVVEAFSELRRTQDAINSEMAGGCAFMRVKRKRSPSIIESEDGLW